MLFFRQYPFLPWSSLRTRNKLQTRCFLAIKKEPAGDSRLFVYSEYWAVYWNDHDSFQCICDSKSSNSSVQERNQYLDERNSLSILKELITLFLFVCDFSFL